MTPEQERDDVLTFWFGTAPAADAVALMAKMRRWYRGGAELDQEITTRFEAVTKAALAGARDAWAETPRGRVALIIALDQFPRSIFREVARSYAGDERAQTLAGAGFAAGVEASLDIEERNFLIMPLVHAEDLALQERGIAEIDRMVAAAADWQRPVLAMGQEQSRKYREVIARFGRFPHRNEILGRTSTPEEMEFLRDWKQRQPPSGMRPPTT